LEGGGCFFAVHHALCEPVFTSENVDLMNCIFDIGPSRTGETSRKCHTNSLIEDSPLTEKILCAKIWLTLFNALFDTPLLTCAHFSDP
jgi:hypothetical protein